MDNAARGAPLVLLRLEGAGVLALAITAYTHLGLSWWLFAALFFTPDLSMLGYLTDPRRGAVVYYVVHTYIAPLALGAAGGLCEERLVLALTVIWIGHIGFDRMLGYGLKYPSAFADTHMGRIGWTK